MQPRQLFDQRDLGVGRAVLALAPRREARLQRRRRRALRALQRVEPAGQPLEEPARLGGAAHLLQRAHAGAQLVEPGERRLQGGVLVADEPEELRGHRLQPLLRAAATLEPRREIRLHRLDRRHAALDPAGHGIEAGLLAGRLRNRTRRARPRLPPLPGRETPGHEEEAEADEREHEGRSDEFHARGSAAGCDPGSLARPKWLECG